MNHPGAALHWRAPRSPRPLMLAVLLLHGAALVGLQWASRPVRSSATPPQRLLLRWIAEPPLAPPPKPASEDDATAPARRAPQQPMPMLPSPIRPDPATALPAPQATQTTTQAITTAPALPPEPAASHPPPLRLDLPRRGGTTPGRVPEADDSPAGQARRDPRGNSAQGRGDRVERALDGGPTTATEEDRGPGRRRYRIGRDCVDVREGRAAGLDPFSASTRPMPKLAEPCRE